jgi:hypothetical protein
MRFGRLAGNHLSRLARSVHAYGSGFRVAGTGSRDDADSLA